MKFLLFQMGMGEEKETKPGGGGGVTKMMLSSLIVKPVSASMQLIDLIIF